MSHNKKEIEIPGESTEEAKELELDEQPKPTRKVSHPATPMSNKEEPSTHDKIKGRRTIKWMTPLRIYSNFTCNRSNTFSLWWLLRTSRENQWLLIKGNDEFESKDDLFHHTKVNHVIVEWEPAIWLKIWWYPIQ